MVEICRNIRFSNSYIDSINKILDKYVLMLKQTMYINIRVQWTKI